MHSLAANDDYFRHDKTVYREVIDADIEKEAPMETEHEPIKDGRRASLIPAAEHSDQKTTRAYTDDIDLHKKQQPQHKEQGSKGKAATGIRQLAAAANKALPQNGKG